MPSVLGLTNDPSPHGPGAEEKQKKKKPVLPEEQDNSNKQVARKPSSSQSPDGGEEKQKKKKKEKTEKKEKKEKKKKPRRYESEDEESEDEGPLNTIKKRNHAKAIEMETLLWGALCHKPKSAIKYLGKGAIMCNPLLFGDADVYSERSEPTLKQVLKECDNPLSFKMHRPHVVEIGLMAMAICTDITFIHQGENGELETEEATISSSWRQCASGDWEMTSSMAGWQD